MNVSIKMNGKKITYILEVEGQTITRNTSKEYKYAIVGFAKDCNKWLASYSGSFQGAEKIADKQMKMSRFTETKIIELVETKQEVSGCDHDKSGFPEGSIVACTNCGKVI